MKFRPFQNQDARGSRSAYTLVEVVFAMAILATMIVSLYGGMSFGFAVTRFERENLRATQIILERLEGIRLFTFDQLNDPNLNPTSFTNYFYPLAGDGQSKGITYIGTMTVESNITLNPPATYSAADMKEVTVTVQWTSGNLQHARSMSTYVARHGVQNYIYNN